MPIDPIIGEMMLWTGQRIPEGWEVADGKELRIVDNTMLFSLIGSRFGGDGVKSFALPDMRDAAPARNDMHWLIAVSGHYPRF